MSHFTKVETKIKNLIILKQALKDLGMTFVEAAAQQTIEIKGWNKEKKNVVMEIKTGGPFTVGVQMDEQNGTYSFVADWWGVEMYTEMNQDQYINKITQKYAYNTIMDKITTKGYTVVNEQVDEKNNVRIVLRKWE